MRNRLFVVCVFIIFPICMAVNLFSAPVKKEDPKPVIPQGADVEVVDGYYEYEGGEGEKRYVGVVTIRKTAQTYVVQYMSGGTTFVGAGMRHGESFIVGWSAPEGRGVTAFTVKEGPKLNGVWVAVPGDGKKHQESLVFLKKFREVEK